MQRDECSITEKRERKSCMGRVVFDIHSWLKQLKSTAKSTTLEGGNRGYIIQTKACITVASAKFLCLNRVIVIVSIHCSV